MCILDRILFVINATHKHLVTTIIKVQKKLGTGGLIMPEYIEREKAYELARTDEYYSDFHRSMADLTSLKELLEDVPTADVVEVRHGEWIPNQYFKGHYYCSKCTRHIEDTSENPSINFPYCHCGAKMDGKGD